MTADATFPPELALPPTTPDARRLVDGIVGADDVRALYLLCLGREPDADPHLLERACGRPLAALATEIATCEEIGTRVLQPLAQGLDAPQATLDAAQGEAVDCWLAGLEGQAPRLEGSTPWPARLARFVDHARISAAMAARHGLLFLAARHELADRLERARFAGKIEFVNREFVYGWALDGDGDPAQPLHVEVWHAGALVAAATAWSLRPDVEERFPGRGQAGFRARWRPQTLPAGVPLELELRDARSRLRIGAPYEFANRFADQLGVAQLLAKELEELKARMDKLAAMVPQALSYAAFPPEHYDLYRRSHRVPPPPWLDPRGAPLGAPVPATLPRFLALVDAKGEAADPIALRHTVDSLRAQHACDWHAVVVTEHPATLDAALLLRAADARIATCPAWPQALAAGPHDAGAEWVLLLRAGERLDAHALAWIADAAAHDPVAVYWDEDALHPGGAGPAARAARHTAPTLRAPFDPDAQLEWNGVGESFAVARAALAQALRTLHETGSRAVHALAPKRRERLLWALHRLGALRHVPQFLLTAPPRPEGAARWIAREDADALAGLLPAAWQGRAWTRVPDPLSDLAPKRLVRWTPRDAEAVVSVLVPTRDHVDLVRQCVDSLRAHCARPQALEIVVADNGSVEPATLAWLADAASQGQLRVLRVDEPFNWSRLNNLMVAGSGGRHLLFLNNDTRMLTPGWDDALRGLLERPDVGAVGARLLYDDMTIQHAGIAFGVEDFVGHAGVATAHDAPEALASTQLTRRVPAVTGAFLACTRETFAQVGGFDEHRLTVAYNDVEWCLRARRRLPGRCTVVAPLLSLVHYESRSRGFDFQDRAKQRRADYERDALAAYEHDVIRAASLHPRASRWLNQSEGLQ